MSTPYNATRVPVVPETTAKWRADRLGGGTISSPLTFRDVVARRRCRRKGIRRPPHAAAFGVRPAIQLARHRCPWLPHARWLDATRGALDDAACHRRRAPDPRHEPRCPVGPAVCRLVGRGVRLPV